MKRMRKKKTIVTIKDSIPAGHSFEIDIPDQIEGELIRIALKAILGGLVGINKIRDERVKRTFMIRFIATIVGEANAAVHNAQMANRLGEKNPAKVVEELLKSLHKDKDKEK